MCAQTTKNMIEELTIAMCGAMPNLRECHVFSQALHALVRLAKSEQVLEIKQDVQRATGLMTGPVARRPHKGTPRRGLTGCNARQGQLQFDRE